MVKELKGKIFQFNSCVYTGSPHIIANVEWVNVKSNSMMFINVVFFYDFDEKIKACD